MKETTISIYQNPPDYYSTGDYFQRASKKLDGVRVHVFTRSDDFDEASETFDVGIHCYPGAHINAKKTFYYERDSRIEWLFGNRHPNYVFYTQFFDRIGVPQMPTDWSDDRVIMHAADPDVHKRVVKPTLDVVFCGRLYPERDKFLKKVEEGLDKHNINLSIFPAGKKPEDYVKHLSAGKIILAPSQFGEINRRIFEVMAIGTCVTDSVFRIDEVGKAGKHFITYEPWDIDGAVDAIVKLHKSPLLIEKMAHDSRKHILEKHTYLHRLKEFLKKGGVKYE